MFLGGGRGTYENPIHKQDLKLSFLKASLTNSHFTLQVEQVCDELAESRMKVGSMWGLFNLGRHCFLPVSLVRV